MAAIISTVAEKDERGAQLSYDVNVTGTKNTLDVAKENGCSVFMPSTIAVFGTDSYKNLIQPLNLIFRKT
jgi:nucleoside-diphosphate-sugar epimerase